MANIKDFSFMRESYKENFFKILEKTNANTNDTYRMSMLYVLTGDSVGCIYSNIEKIICIEDCTPNINESEKEWIASWKLTRHVETIAKVALELYGYIFEEPVTLIDLYGYLDDWNPELVLRGLEYRFQRFVPRVRLQSRK